MAITKPPVLPAWADAGDKVQPSNAELSVGWPVTSTPPSRQRFNWVLNFVANAVRYFSRRGLVDYDAAETYMTGDRIIGDDGKTYRSLIDNNTAQTPSTSPTKWERWGFSLADLGSNAQTQATTAFTTAGAAPNFTLTPVPAPAALTANLRLRVKFHAAGAGSDVINIAGLGNKSLKQFDLTGAKVAANIRANQLADIEYDGADLIVLDPLPTGLGSFLVSIGVSTTLTFQDVGKSFIGGSATAFTLTLPLASACQAGSRISFQNFNSGVMTIARQGTDNINNGQSNTSIPLGIGGILEVECLPSGQWYVTKMSGLGVDQRWQSMGRAFSTTFTNTTGKPIALNVEINNGTLSILVDGAEQWYSASNATFISGFTIVPPGSTYQVISTGSLIRWGELRV